MAPSKATDDLMTLQSSIASVTSLISSFHLALQSPTLPHPPIKSPPQPLALLADSCKILKAQTTKLSLLILNEPFTPSEVSYILNTCSSGCLPAMMSVLELCEAKKYTAMLHNNLKSSLSRLMVELLNLIACIPKDEHGIDPQGRDILASTGVLWAECDKMVTLASDGLVSFAVHKAEEYHSLLKDAIAELEDWDPEEDDSESDTDSILSSKQKPMPSVTSGATTIDASLGELTVSSMTELRRRSLNTLRTIRVIYPALQKRRISTFPNITSATRPESLPLTIDIESLDSTIASTQAFTEAADEIAGALYEGDEAEVSRRLTSLHEEAELCASIVKRNWGGNEDEFSRWVVKWLARLKEVAAG